MKLRAALLFFAAPLLQAGEISTTAPAADEKKLRDLNPDRPSSTDNPDTIDAGHAELEYDFANYGWAHQDHVTTRTWNIAPITIRYGVTDKIEFQANYGSYSHTVAKDEATGVHTDSHGWGDLQLRMKYNFWGNGEGSTSFGIISSVLLPTSTGGQGNDLAEGGISLPFYADLGGGWNVSVTFAANAVRDPADDLKFNWLGGAGIGKNLTESTSVYLEYINSDTPGVANTWNGLIDIGFAWTLTPNLQVDCGCNFGVSPDTERYHPFVGMSVRF